VKEKFIVFLEVIFASLVPIMVLGVLIALLGAPKTGIWIVQIASILWISRGCK